MHKASTAVMFALAVVIFVAFFLPWVSVESPMVGTISKALTGKRQASIDAISGFDIPAMANSADARLMISIIQIFNPGIKDADKKSYLIWLVPILGVAIFLVFLFLGRNRWVDLAIGLIGIAIFAVAVYKIKTTDLDKLVLNVKISNGLWMLLWGYLGMGLAGAANFATSLLKEKK